ncbi:MAG: hypothetical protein B7Y25_03845 [Alphaproteobacteria bacterium 16-39-46]|nr:MAG: hypothetical protein B7Y25_03845 [Alphaproteobacteria bacterium 16-39-46]OZA43291.1 MAG: hypothetical protein B7X84_03680 [Alphaproteobacteria bacterium 17-39-52]HQS84069.1 hypothetical protein [Alphaproteobacteria bacterium]HQS93931.1 hypothetical protein [Alphaproteobacteria bacterium]
MAKLKNEGLCTLCQKIVPYQSILKHIKGHDPSSTKEEPSSEKEKIFLIKVFQGPYFWLYIEINGNATLNDLDTFLRDIWLECCGHMSQFTINGDHYESHGPGLNKKIHQTLNENSSFSYCYDFGSSTYLGGKVLASRPGKLPKTLRLIARNTLPEDVVCRTCGEAATVICCLCSDLSCEKCRKNHECQEDDMMSPVVNSPRMGVCGYTGEAW